MYSVKNRSESSENSSSNMNNTSCRNKRKGQKHRRSFTMPVPPVGDAHLRKVWWNYWEARSWQHRHQVACWRSQVEALQYENQMLHGYIKVLLTGSPENDAQETQFPSDGQVPSPTPSQKAKRNRKRRIRRKRNARSKDDFDETADDSDFCSDVDEELLDFMEQTIRHRLERDNHPILERLRDRNGDQKVDPECVVQPQESVDRNHLEEMQEMFGLAAPKLLAMETAMQLTFNSNCDRHCPKPWPVLPLAAQSE